LSFLLKIKFGSRRREKNLLSLKLQAKENQVVELKNRQMAAKY